MLDKGLFSFSFQLTLCPIFLIMPCFIFPCIVFTVDNLPFDHKQAKEDDNLVQRDETAESGVNLLPAQKKHTKKWSRLKKYYTAPVNKFGFHLV